MAVPKIRLMDMNCSTLFYMSGLSILQALVLVGAYVVKLGSGVGSGPCAYPKTQAQSFSGFWLM
jgi:hypothetical protein